MDKDDIVCEIIISQQGCYKRVKRWIRGYHPEKGIITFGFTGPETIVETDVITPIYYFMVVDK